MELLRKYNAATTIYFPLVDAGANDFEATPASFAAGDVQFSEDGAAFANTGSLPAHEGNGIYSLALIGSELSGKTIVITIIDQTATKVWEDQAIVITTYGHASAQIVRDIGDAVRGGMTALPNAAAEAAGGLATSSAGGLDLDDLALADKLLAYVQLLCRSDAAIATDRATEENEINADQGSGVGDFSNLQDSNEKLQDDLAAVPTAAEIDTELTSSHGAGSWAGSSSDIVVATGTVGVTVAVGSFYTNLTDDDDHWKLLLIQFTSGVNDGKCAWIETFANTNGVITLSEDLDEAPANGDTFKIMAFRATPLALERSPRLGTK